MLYLLFQAAFALNPVATNRQTRNLITAGPVKQCVNDSSMSEIEELKNRIAGLEEKLAEKDAEREKETGRFMLMTHQLRAPLVSLQTVIKGIMQGAAEDPAAMQRLLGMAHSRSEEMLRTIEEMILLGRLYAGGGAGFLEGACDAAEVLEKCIDTVAPPAADRNIVIIKTVDGKTQVQISARALEHIFVNIIENAVKYSHPDSSVHVGLHDDGEAVIFSVRDEGIGIPHDLIETVFDEFTRADNARKHTKTGTGLGMPIVKRIIEAAGGTIALNSEEGKGTCVDVKLPRTAG